MRFAPFHVLTIAASLLLSAATSSNAAHRATRLGNPATRFAPPLNSPEDLRDRFRDPKLRPDFKAVLDQWGWIGDADDLHRAALSEEIISVEIPNGSRMPFMSSRKNGKATCLKDVLWAGKEPIQAYAFSFISKGRKYRCITPRPCSNFFIEDHGPAVIPMPKLAIHCNTPERQFTGRPIKICLTVSNSGNGPERRATVTLPIPLEATATSATDGGKITPGLITWELFNVAPGSPKEVCAIMTARQPGKLAFNGTVKGTLGTPASCDCETKILGIYAILVEVIDIEDPIQVGERITYVITATNQGDQAGTNVRFVATVPPDQSFVSATGVTPVSSQGRTIIADALPTLAGKATATWRVVTRAVSRGDSRFIVDFSSDQFQAPIREEESTHLY